MQIQGNNSIIDKLICGKDEVVFNLVSLIRGQNNARLYTDGRCYLTAQANANCPMWVYVNAQADKRTEEELFCAYSEALKENTRLAVNAREGFAEKTLSSFAEQYGLKLFKRNPLNAYFIREVREITPVGEFAVSEEKYTDDIVRLIIEAAVDGGGDMTDEEAMQFAKAHANSGNLYLWLNGGVVSMARVIRSGTKYARLTSIVTERAVRGKGYAKMLVGELSKRMLAERVTPVLYANSENPSSNRCYQKLGFEKAGEICEFRLEK